MKHILLICLVVLMALPVRAEFGLSNVVKKDIHRAGGIQPSPAPQLAQLPQPQAAGQNLPAQTPAPASVPGASAAPFTKVLHYPYTIHLASWDDQADAARQFERMRSKLDPIFITKIDLGPSGIWFRLDYGFFPNVKDAVLKLQDLKARGLVDQGSFVGGSVPYAIEIGQFQNRQDAASKARVLAEKGVITYMIKEKEDLYRLLSGAYPNAQSAAPEMKDLAELNLNPVIKKR